MLVSLGEGLANQGSSVTLAAFRDSREPHTEVLEFAAQRGLQTHAIPCKGRFDWGVVRHIRSLVSQRAIGIVHSHGYKANIYSYFSLRGLPVIRVATCHNWPAGARILQLYAKIDRVFLKAFDAISTPSPLVARLLVRAGVAASKVRVIGNGVNMSRFSDSEPRLAREIDGSPLIGLVGRLTTQKGGFVLLRAAKTILIRFPKAKIVFVGDGPARAELTSFAASLGIADSVVFAGVRDDMPGVYASLDVVTLPSLEEAMPMCLLEAMAARRPVVATNVGAVPEIVHQGVTGYLVDPGDTAALADGVLSMLENRAMAGGIAGCAYEHVLKHHSNEVMTSSYVSLYRHAFNERFPGQMLQPIAGVTIDVNSNSPDLDHQCLP